MKTPHLDNLINDLKIYDKNDMLSDDGRNQLNEYEAIRQALSLVDALGQSEQSPRSFGMVRWFANEKEDVACVSIEKAKEYVEKYNKLSGKNECYVDEEICLLLNENNKGSIEAVDLTDKGNELYTLLTTGQLVGLDKDLANSSEVTVVRQTPKRMFTTVTSNGIDEWDVMTYRLTALNS